MDPVTIFSTIAGIVQLVEVSAKISKRLIDYVQAHAGDVPKPLENISTFLPLIVRSLSQIQDESKISSLDSDTRYILYGVILGCSKLTKELNEIAERISNKPGESVGSKLRRGLASIKFEERIKSIDKGLQAYVQVLILHQVINKSEVKNASASDTKFFEVKAKRLDDSVSRAEHVSQLHANFSAIVQSQAKTPSFVVLQGPEGAGKTHIAVEYAHEAYSLEHYRAVFWLDARTPEALTLALENIASVIRRSKDGSSEERLAFTNRFLTERWHPWLLILDNFVSEAFADRRIESFLPDKGLGAILITSRPHHSPASDPYGTVIKVFKFLTEDEDYDLRYRISSAIRSKDLSSITDALENGLDVNSYSADVFNRKHQAMINLAAETGFHDGVRLFLQYGADPHLVKAHSSALSQAASSRDLETLEVCLDHEDNTSYQFEKEDYEHAIRSALRQGDLPILRSLLARRGDRINLDGRWFGEGLQEAANEGHLEAMRLLFLHHKMPTRGRAGALRQAIDRGDLEMVEFLLNEVGVHPNEQNDRGEPSLNTAVSCTFPPEKKGVRLSIVNLLLKAGASPNLKDNRLGSTSLHMACLGDHANVMKVLLEYGGDPTVEVNHGGDPGEDVMKRAVTSRARECLALLACVKIADAEKHARYYARALNLAARRDDRELIVMLKDHADINSTWGPQQDTPLLAAIKADKLQVARLIVRMGANQHVNDVKGNTAFLLAAEKGMALLVRDLAKAKDSDGIEVTDRQGNTALILAARHKHTDTVKMLLKLGANKDAENQFMEKAIDIVEEIGDEDLIAALESL